VGSKAECDQLNLAHVARNKKYKKKTNNKQTLIYFNYRHSGDINL